MITPADIQRALLLRRYRLQKPYAYEVAWLESLGAQYINTLQSFVLNDNFIIEIRYQITTLPNVSQQYSGMGYTTSGESQCFIAHKKTGITYYGLSSSGIFFTEPEAGDYNFHTYKLQRDSGYSNVYKDSILLKSESVGIGNVSYFYLFNFAIQTGALSTGGVNGIKCKLSNFKCIKNGVLVSAFIPVVDFNGVACMYDRVTGNLFYNKGTGSFTVGTRV